VVAAPLKITFSVWLKFRFNPRVRFTSAFIALQPIPRIHLLVQQLGQRLGRLRKSTQVLAPLRASLANVSNNASDCGAGPWHEPALPN